MNATGPRPATPTDTTVRIGELAAVHAGLARAFGEVGIGGQKLDDIFSLAITAQCVGCGITVSGTDLAHISVAPGQAVASEPKLDRLRLGYCARNGCNAKFYRIFCENLPGVDAAKLVARGLELRHAPPPEPEPEPDAVVGPRPVWWKQPKRLLAIAVLVLVVIWVFRFASERGLVPGVAPKPVYKTVPSHSREAL